jgi:hypothetical protein
MVERTTVRLPGDLIRRARRKALDEGRSLTVLIEDGLRRVLDEGPRTSRGARVLPPVSTATGGLMPGIDLDDRAAMREAEDMELAERLA